MSDPRVQEALDLGLAAAKDKLYSVAIRHFDSALDLEPTNQHALRFLAFAHFEAGHTVDAVLLLERYLTLWPNDDQAQRTYSQARDKIQEDLARHEVPKPPPPEVEILPLKEAPPRKSPWWNPEFDVSSGRKGPIIVIGCLVALWWFWPEFSSVFVPKTNSQASTASQSPKPIKLTFEEFNKMFGINSTLTDLQKKERFMDYEGFRVRWTGRVVDVDTSAVTGGLTASFQHLPDTLSMDVLVDFPTSEREQLSSILKGSIVTYEGTLSSYGGALLPTYLVEGRVVSVGN